MQTNERLKKHPKYKQCHNFKKCFHTFLAFFQIYVLDLTQ